MHGEDSSTNDQMHVELQVALNFIISYLYNKLPRTRVHLYGEELEKLLLLKFQGHWYPSNPVKGSAYRCVHLNSTEIDPCFEIAAVRSGLDFVNDIKNNLPSELSVWVDPREVSYAIGGPDGKPGPVNVLYRQPSGSENSQDDPKTKKQEFTDGNVIRSNACNSYMTFNPHAKDFMPKAPTVPTTEPVFLGDMQGFGMPGQMAPVERPQTVSIGYSLRPARRLYTVDEFASTKFGSTKMKTHARNLTPFQRMPQPTYPNHPNYLNTSPSAPVSGLGFNQDALPTSPMESSIFSPFSAQARPSSLATSSPTSGTSPGSSTSSSPDHVKAQMMKSSSSTHSSPPSSPWGDTFSLPLQSYNSLDTWPRDQSTRDFPSPQEDFLNFARIRDFNPFADDRPHIPLPTSNQRIASMT